MRCLFSGDSAASARAADASPKEKQRSQQSLSFYQLPSLKSKSGGPDGMFYKHLSLLLASSSTCCKNPLSKHGFPLKRSSRMAKKSLSRKLAWRLVLLKPRRRLHYINKLYCIQNESTRARCVRVITLIGRLH